MSFEHKYDLVVSTGEYKDRNGATKKRWLTIGKLFEGDRGPFLILEPYINLGALPLGPKGSVVVNCYEPKNREGQDSAPRSTGNKPAQQRSHYDDDVPF